MSESRRSCWRNDHLRMCWVFVSNLVEEKIIIESLLKFSYKLVTAKFILLLLFTLLHNSLSVVNILHAFISNVNWNESRVNSDHLTIYICLLLYTSRLITLLVLFPCFGKGKFHFPSLKTFWFSTLPFNLTVCISYTICMNLLPGKCNAFKWKNCGFALISASCVLYLKWNQNAWISFACSI